MDDKDAIDVVNDDVKTEIIVETTTTPGDTMTTEQPHSQQPISALVVRDYY